MAPNFKFLTLEFNDKDFVTAILLISKYPPFFNYSFRLMLMKVLDQLNYKTNVAILLNNKVVAYAGWVNVKDSDASVWQIRGGELPRPQWDGNDAAIVTIAVTENSRYLLPLMRAISDRNQGIKVYANRTFMDGRKDQRRPAVRGSPQQPY